MWDILTNSSQLLTPIDAIFVKDQKSCAYSKFDPDYDMMSQILTFDRFVVIDTKMGLMVLILTNFVTEMLKTSIVL